MATEFERKESAGGLTFKLYRGEGLALLAFDLDQAQATDDFVGFSIEVQYPGSTHWGALKNRLHFDYPPDLKRPAFVSFNRSAVSEIPLDPRANGGQAGRVPISCHRLLYERCRETAHRATGRKCHLA